MIIFVPASLLQITFVTVATQIVAKKKKTVNVVVTPQISKKHKTCLFFRGKVGKMSLTNNLRDFRGENRLATEGNGMY